MIGLTSLLMTAQAILLVATACLRLSLVIHMIATTEDCLHLQAIVMEAIHQDLDLELRPVVFLPVDVMSLNARGMSFLRAKPRKADTRPSEYSGGPPLPGRPGSPARYADYPPRNGDLDPAGQRYR